MVFIAYAFFWLGDACCSNGIQAHPSATRHRVRRRIGTAAHVAPTDSDELTRIGAIDNQVRVSVLRCQLRTGKRRKAMLRTAIMQMNPHPASMIKITFTDG